MEVASCNCAGVSVLMQQTALSLREGTLLFCLGVSVGAFLFNLLTQKGREDDEIAEQFTESLRRKLPSTIILIRHGESQGNADHTLFRTMPDNLVCLTEKGEKQAIEAGRRIHDILFPQIQPERVQMIVSPFERTLQTAAFLRKSIEPWIVRTEIESRIREQEFGNLQNDEFHRFRREQQKVGRFWYRFPTGESGADVYDRVKSWWFESVETVNLRVGYKPVDTLVVITHGLTMRFVLMQLFHWSPTTFHSVWNAENCDMYVLRKDLSKPGSAPYVLCDKLGDMPKSSIDVAVTFQDNTRQIYQLHDYLSVLPPRTTREKTMREMLVQQYPAIEAEKISRIQIIPFVTGDSRSTVSPLKSYNKAKQEGYGGKDIFHSNEGFGDYNSTAVEDFELSLRFSQPDMAFSVS